MIGAFLFIDAKIVKWAREGRGYMPFLAGLLIFWSLVPAFAKLGELNGIQQTFWINLFALLALTILIPVTKRLGRRRKSSVVSLEDLLKISALGFFWPFLFSIFYFEAVYQGSPAFVSIAQRTSILIYAPLSMFIFGRSLSTRDIMIMVVAVLSAGIALSGGIHWKDVTLLSILLAFGAAATTGLYTAYGEAWRRKYDPLFMILIIEAVTVLCAAVLILLTNSYIFPTGITLFYLLFIGVLANGVAFWFYLEGFQRASALKDRSHKVFFLVVQSAVLVFAQVLLVSLLGAEVVSPALWVGAAVLLLGMAWYHLTGRPAA